MYSDVVARIKRNSKLLFSRDSVCLQELCTLLELQNRRSIVMWALERGKEILWQIEQKYPDEPRPRICLDLCEVWARGRIKMPAAQKAILAAHAAAKGVGDAEYAALCHAGSTVHTEKHVIGLPMYELTSIVLKHGPESFAPAVSETITGYTERLLYWQEQQTGCRFSGLTF